MCYKYYYNLAIDNIMGTLRITIEIDQDVSNEGTCVRYKYNYDLAINMMII